MAIIELIIDSIEHAMSFHSWFKIIFVAIKFWHFHCQTFTEIALNCSFEPLIIFWLILKEKIEQLSDFELIFTHNWCISIFEEFSEIFNFFCVLSMLTTSKPLSLALVRKCCVSKYWARRGRKVKWERKLVLDCAADTRDLCTRHSLFCIFLKPCWDAEQKVLEVN